MKVSKEIVKIQNRLKKLTYKQAKYIMISTEYYQYQNVWYVFPLFQEEGNEYITYIANPFPSTESNIVEGKGKSLISAFKDLSSVLDKVEQNNYKLYKLA
jgi:hypothetical protein